MQTKLLLYFHVNGIYYQQVRIQMFCLGHATLASVFNYDIVY